MPANRSASPFSTKTFIRSLLLAGAGLPLLWSGPAMAQRTVEGRVDRLEQEMRAVQRKVFPGGAGQLVAPEVTPPAPTPGVAAGAPASTPIADLMSRVSTIEAQLARLTGQVEENDHRLRQLEDAYKKLTAPPALPALGTGGLNPTSPAQGAPRDASGVTGDTPLLARTEEVAAVERPSTGNAASDSYTYGFRLWDAKFYPEAQVQLQETVDQYGKESIGSRAQNLLGRAYLDDNKPAAAAKIFYENYRERPKGDRAAESLAWVGESLIQLNRLKDACLAYDELADVFGSNMPGNVRDMMAKGRTRAKCGG